MILKEFYENFHKAVRAPSGLPSEADFTYGNPIAFVRRNVKPGDRVLDVGCGNGVLSMFAASLGCEVLALDISERAVQEASRGAWGLGLKGVTFMNADFPNFRGSGRFDAVLCFDVLEHIPNDGTALDAIRQALRPGGKLLLRVPSSSAPLHRLRIGLTGRDRFDESVGHLRRYSPRDLSRLLEESGFEVLEIEPVEGWLRNSLFTTSLGGRLLRYALHQRTAELVTAADNLVLKFFGDSGFNTAAVSISERARIGELRNPGTGGEPTRGGSM